jgi:O-antigen/teichoic acid export membrane protein
MDPANNTSADIITAEPSNEGSAVLARAAAALLRAAGWHSRLVRGAIGVVALRVSLAIITLFLNIFLVRWLGTAEYGAYAYCLAWLLLLGVPALLGLDQLLVRSVAGYRVRSAWGSLRGLLRQAAGAAALAAVALAAAAAAVAWLCTSPTGGRTFSTFCVGLVLLPLITLTRVRQAILQGLHHVVLAQLPETVQPLLLLALVTAAWLGYGETLTAPLAMEMNVIATAVAFGAGLLLLWWHLPRVAAGEPAIAADWSWLKSSLPLMCFSAINVFTAEIDLLILGALKGPAAVGVYSVAVRTAELIPFVLLAICPAIAPQMARLHAAADSPGLQRLVTTATRALLALALPVALFLILRGDWFLGLLYGAELIQAQPALVILSLGQLINVAMGPVGMLLTMTGHERNALLCIALSGTLNFVLSVLLIPAWGAAGAAVASCLSLILWNLIMAICAARRLQIHCGVFGRIVEDRI